MLFICKDHWLIYLLPGWYRGFSTRKPNVKVRQTNSFYWTYFFLHTVLVPFKLFHLGWIFLFLFVAIMEIFCSLFHVAVFSENQSFSRNKNFHILIFCDTEWAFLNEIFLYINQSESLTFLLIIHSWKRENLNEFKFNESSNVRLQHNVEGKYVENPVSMYGKNLILLRGCISRENLDLLWLNRTCCGRIAAVHRCRSRWGQ